MRKKITQREAIFYRLFTAFKEDPNGRYIPVFEFMGEHFCKELSLWGYVSYECSARLSEMISTNPLLIHREKIKGKSGAEYYGYRFNPNAKPDLIADLDLKTFYKRIKR